MTTGATFSWDGTSRSELGSMKTPREFHACVEKDGIIYALGGEDDYKLKSVEKLNLATGVWSEGPDLPYMRFPMFRLSTFMGKFLLLEGRGLVAKLLSWWAILGCQYLIIMGTMDLEDFLTLSLLQRIK